MDLSVLVAKIISAIYISAGLSVLLGNLDFNKIVEDFEKSSALTFIAGAVGLGCGVTMLQFHNIWTNDWRVLITLISWGMLLGGFTVVVWPRSLSWFSGIYKISRLWGIVMIAFGLLFGYFGFVMK